MKGIIFTELVEFIERHSSITIAQKIIDDADLPSSGSYTTVGNYPHDEALSLVSAAASEMQARPEDLMRLFGNELFDRLVLGHPEFFPEHIDNAMSFLSIVQSHIHTEVVKLWPESSPPQVQTELTDDQMKVTYRSHRPFAMIALGLIEGCCAHFDGSFDVTYDKNLSATDSSASFLITKLGSL